MMKTSNILFISFLVFLFGGITLLCIASKFYKGYNDKTNFVTQETKTAPFSVVVAEAGANLIIKNGKECSISQKYRKDTIPDFSRFEVRNDTLFLSAINAKKLQSWYALSEVYCKNVKSIIGKEKAYIKLDNYKIDSLDIHLNKAELSWKFNKIGVVNIDATKSNINFNGNHIEEINLELDKTQLYISSKSGVKKISGNLINNSEFQGATDGKVAVTVDQSSRLYVRN